MKKNLIKNNIVIIVGGNMFTYNIEYRENVLFIRFIGSLNKYTIKCIDVKRGSILLERIT